MADAKKTCSVAEAAEFLGVGRDTAYSAVRSGQIPALKIGKLYRIPIAGLERMIDTASKQQAAA